MRKNQKIIIYLVTALSALALIFLISHTIVAVRRQTEEHCFTYLDEATNRLAADLYKTTDMDHTVLTAMASLIAVEDSSSDENLRTIMNSYVSNTSYISYVEILRPDNMMLDADGTVRDVGDALEFKREVQKGAYVSDIDQSTKDPEVKILRNAVPVTKDGKVIYMLYGVIRLTDLAEKFTTNIYDGNAYVYLVDSNSGDFILDSWHKSFGNISDFNDRKIESGDNFPLVAEKMKKGLSGDLSFVSHTTGDTLYMHYAPVGFNNWSVIVTVQDHYALRSSQEVNDTLFAMAAWCGIIVFCYMLFVTLSLLAAYHRIRKLGMNDQITGLQNRNAYDVYLALNHHKTYGLVSCVFVDANGLHELNNLKGHDAGDAMLHSVAVAMQAVFPTHDIFRTGGDEFVAIMENMEEDACKQSAEKMRKTLADEGYSVSYGAVTQHGASDISEIIHLADERMMENKRHYYSKHDRRMR